jgi:RecJ-like exonuclease
VAALSSSVAALAPPELVRRAEEGLALVDGARRVRIVTHHDADGTTAAAILARALLRRGKAFHVSQTTVFDETVFRRMKEEDDELVLMSDMGSGQLDLLERLEVPVVVLDHHKPLRDSDKVVHVNPHLVGIDGVRGACGATTSWLFVLLMDDANWDLAGVAMAGAIADRQHVAGYEGLNATLFREAIQRNLLTPEKALAFPDRPLAEAIAGQPSPYLVALTGRPEDVAALLGDLNLDPTARLRDLSSEERRMLASYLATRLAKQGARPDAIRTLVEEKHWSERDGLYVNEMSAYVNACARLGRQGVGLGLCLGDRDALVEAEGLRRQHTEELLAALRRLEEEGPHALAHIQFFYADEGSLTGEIASIAMQFFLDQRKATVGLAVTDGTTRVSSRGTKELVEAGVDLAAAMRDAAETVGGVGGGHNVAAGATVPKGKEEPFLARVDEIVGAQLQAGSKG